MVGDWEENAQEPLWPWTTSLVPALMEQTACNLVHILCFWMFMDIRDSSLNPAYVSKCINVEELLLTYVHIW